MKSIIRQSTSFFTKNSETKATKSSKETKRKNSRFINNSLKLNESANVKGGIAVTDIASF